MRGSALSLSQVLRDLNEVDMHSFILQLKRFLERVPLQETVRKELTDIKVSFTFSYTFFKKFEEIWEKLVPGNGETQIMKQIAWVFFILCKVEILKKKMEVVDCALMLIGALHFILIRFPPSLQSTCTGKSSDEVLLTLTELLKTQVRFALPYTGKATEEMKGLVQQRLLRAGSDSDNLSDVFSRGDLLADNLRGLSCCYQQFLTPDDIDERDFILPGKMKLITPKKQRVPMTPFAKQTDGSQKLISQRLLRWDATAETNAVSMQSKIEDVKMQTDAPARTPVPMMTPMTQAMEMNNWLTSLIDSIELIGLNESLRNFCSKCHPNPEPEITDRLSLFRSALEATFTAKNIGSNNDSKLLEKHLQASLHIQVPQVSNPKVDLVLKLYLQMLESMLENEGRKNASANFTLILNNDSFHRSLLASCLESILFLHNIAKMSFEEVLEVSGISGFEFWKIITTFCNVDPRMPIPLKSHFRVIEIKIITSLGWVRGSPVHQAIKSIAQQAKNVITEDTSEEDEEGQEPKPRPEPLHVTYDLFFRRVLSFTGYRVLTLTEELGVPPSLQEDTWNVMKFFLSEKTELLIDRHLDQVILCAVFGICKAKAHALKFAQIVDLYGKLNPDELVRVSREVRLEAREGSIIDFYNEVMISHIKEFTSGHRRSDSFRISSFSPESSLRSTISPQFLHLADRRIQSPMVGKSPFRSPYMTPMTRRLFAAPESPAVHTSDRCIDFDHEEKKYEPMKKPKHLEDIFSPCKGELDLPNFKKE